MPSAYRTTGATLPFGDLAGHHGAGMEGHFWRLTHAASGRVVIVILAISRDRDGRAWSMVSLATHPEGRVVSATVGEAETAAVGFGVGAGAALAATGDVLRVRLEGAELDVAFATTRAVAAPGLRGARAGRVGPRSQPVLAPVAAGRPRARRARARRRGASPSTGRRSTPRRTGARAACRRAWWWGQATPSTTAPTPASRSPAGTRGSAGSGCRRVPWSSRVGRLVRSVVRPPPPAAHRRRRGRLACCAAAASRSRATAAGARRYCCRCPLPARAAPHRRPARPAPRREAAPRVTRPAGWSTRASPARGAGAGVRGSLCPACRQRQRFARRSAAPTAPTTVHSARRRSAGAAVDGATRASW